MEVALVRVFLENIIMGDEKKKANLYRMVKPDHLCPYGLKSKWLLERHGYEVEDNHLNTDEETDTFKQKHGVKTTPQTFIRGQRVGGYSELREKFSSGDRNNDSKSYAPVLIIFAMAVAISLVLNAFVLDTVFSLQFAEWSGAFMMILLSILKLRDVESFSTMFLNYDLLARRQVGYAYVYPFAEGGAGILMLSSGILALVAAPVSLFIGTVGAVSVIKAVYIDKRELKCACVGGDSNVPLGFISLSENIIMMLMGLWMLIKFVFVV